MKKIYVFFVVVGLFNCATAQLRVKQCGQVQVGKESVDVANVSKSYLDTLTMCQFFGPYGNMGEGARISFGDQASRENLNVLVGELGTTDCDLLWLHGKRGVYFTTVSTAQDTIAYCDLNKGRYFQFNCDLRTSGVLVQSDERFKENITPIESASSNLGKLKAVSYKLKPQNTDVNPMLSPASNSEVSEKDMKDKAFMERYYQLLRNQPTRFGLIAQEVKAVFPELVATDSLGYMYVDYIGLIPLLIDAVNELSYRTDSLQTVVSEMQREGMVSQKLFGGVEDGIGNLECVLYQNSPNPFNVSTRIRCTLPHNALDAMIFVYDLQGTQKLGKAVDGRGDTFVEIRGSELPAGMYIYTLVVDGREIDSKRMIITG